MSKLQTFWSDHHQNGHDCVTTQQITLNLCSKRTNTLPYTFDLLATVVGANFSFEVTETAAAIAKKKIS